MADALYSPGLEGIIAAETAISSLEGGLFYRGYPIEELAANSTFEETAFLLLHGELPRADELSAFRARLSEAAALPPEVLAALRLFPARALPMDVLRTTVSLLGMLDPDAADGSPEANVRKAERLLARLPAAITAFHRIRQGLAPVSPDPRRPLAANLLWMLHGHEPSATQAKALDITLVVYAENELNASTFSARAISSTLSDLHSAVTGAIGALKGPLHGGANEEAMQVLLEIGGPEHAERWVRQAFADKRRIMGFGHRVYKNGDPRARFLKPLCQNLSAEVGMEDLEWTAEIVERIVTSEKGLPPNVDWPTARLYHYLGLPIDLYTPLFALARTAGWSAHVAEQLANNRLIRPLGRYVGAEVRPWVPLDDR